MKTKKKTGEYYVNNRQFSEEVQRYADLCRAAKKDGQPNPEVPQYIWESLIKIAEGLSRKPNFIMYSYKADFIMEGIEDCLKALPNYNIGTTTRTGKPNAFSYFTQCCFWAYVRRINKEKKESELRIRYLKEISAEEAADQMVYGASSTFREGLSSYAHTVASQYFKDSRKKVLEKYTSEVANDDEYIAEEKVEQKRRRDNGDSDLNEFLN